MPRLRIRLQRHRKEKEKLNERRGSEKQHNHYVRTKEDRQSTHNVTLVHAGAIIYAVGKQKFLNMSR
jgi:hypothetical protein